MSKQKRAIGRKFAGVYTPADTKNLEKYPAWTKPLAEMFKQMMLNGFIRNTFYVDEKKLINLAVDIIKRFVVKSPFEAMEIASYGRNEGFMRTLPIVALSYSSKVIALGPGETRRYPFKESFLKIIKTPRDLEQFIDITRSHRGLGRSIKSMINAYIHEKLSPFYAYRYKNQLKLAIKLAHPKIKDKTKDNLIRYIMDKEELSWTSNEVPKELRAIEELKNLEKRKAEGNTEDVEQLQCDLIKNGRLHPDIVKGVLKPTEKMWDILMDNAPAMYLVKNLVAFTKHLGPGRILKKLIDGALTIERMRKGRVLPFRLLQAWSMMTSDFKHNSLKEWIGQLTEGYAKDYDFSNLGSVAVCPDISGSMSSNPDRGSLSYSQIAGLFAGIFCVGIKDSALIPWEGQVRLDYQKLYPRWRNVETIWKICQDVTNGTTMSAPVNFMLRHDLKYDTCIFITDSEEWMGSPWLEAWIQYKRIHPKAKAVLIRIDTYNTNPFPYDIAEKHSIYQIYGVSDTVFKMLEVLGKDESKTN